MAFDFTQNTPSSRETSGTTPTELQEQRRKNELARMRLLLGQEVAEQVLPEGITVTGFHKEYFQSRTFRTAAYDTAPDEYGNSDRSLTTVDLEAGAQVFILEGRISSGNPYEVGPAEYHMMDLRPDYHAAYTYDGQETITEYRDGTINTFRGQYGVPDALLPYTRQQLGLPVGSETF